MFDAWFRYNGIDSRDMGIKVIGMPENVWAEKDVSSVLIAGRDGSLHIDRNAYKPYIRTMKCAIIDRRNIDRIGAWLCGSHGRITFSDEPDKAYEIYISNAVSIVDMMRKFQRFIVSMETQPFKYHANRANDAFEVTMVDEVYNTGTIYSKPIITVETSNDVTLIINGKRFRLESVTGTAIINSAVEEVYSPNGESLNKNYKTRNFPRFEVGKNTIEVVGADKIKIDPEWRWL